MENSYDLIIIGTGPAGLGAAIYGQRALLKILSLEENYVSGGQMSTTYEVDNYPAKPGISGMDLGMEMREHAERMGAEIRRGKVRSIQREGELSDEDRSSGHGSPAPAAGRARGGAADGNGRFLLRHLRRRFFQG